MNASDLNEFSNTIKNQFFQGEYLSILSKIESNQPPTNSMDFWSLELRSYLIGAYGFAGNLTIAEYHFSHFKKNCELDKATHARSFFFMAVTYIRCSHYNESKKCLQDICQLFRRFRNKLSNESLEELKFYCFQGIAFFNFFRGRFQRSYKYSQKAYFAALGWGENYGILLSTDLRSHILIKIGHIKVALHSFEQALTLAKKNNFLRNASAIEMSLLMIRCQTRTDWIDTIPLLKVALQKTSTEDSYTKSELMLEISNQLFLQGRGTEAKVVLEQASEDIYKFGHRRQTALLHLRLAHLFYVAGENSAARALISAQIATLNPEIDIQLQSAFDGLANLLRVEISNPKKSVQSKIYFNAIDDRIKARMRLSIKDDATNNTPLKENIEYRRLEDLVGDVFDDAMRSPWEHLETLKDRKLLGLLPKVFKLKNGIRAIIIRGKNLPAFIVFPPNVVECSYPLTRTHVHILCELAMHKVPLTRDLLFSKVWGVRFKVQMHERTLQSALSRLRRALGDYQSILLYSSEGFQLAENVQVLAANSFQREVTNDEVKNLTNSIETDTYEKVIANAEPFNFRQLKYLKPDSNIDYISVSSWARLFQVSVMTAFRDINLLLKQGKIKKTGNGRATRYTKS